MGRAKRASFSTIQPWELDLIKVISRRFRTMDREDLESDLAAELLNLKSRSQTAILNWRAYVTKVLYNKASNWVRDRRARETKSLSLDAPSDDFLDATPWVDRFALQEPGHDFSVAFSQLWADLDPHLQGLWMTLVEEQGNQVKVAERLGKHRNTVRKWIREIQRLIEKHGP